MLEKNFTGMAVRSKLFRGMGGEFMEVAARRKSFKFFSELIGKCG